MKRLLRFAPIAAVIAAGLTLGACATTDTGTTTPTTPIITTGNASIDAFAVKVQDATIAACKFKPTIDTVAGIFLSGNPIYTTVSGVVNAICNAVNPPIVASTKRRGPASTPPTVAGVLIEGQFIR